MCSRAKHRHQIVVKEYSVYYARMFNKNQARNVPFMLKDAKLTINCGGISEKATLGVRVIRWPISLWDSLLIG